ncbi:MAG: hypothetical protein EBR82_18980 [Caulobacteraceae bacterium]|nr:hypothetical protein [Caulobacteraceae bacterium]
MTTLGYGVLDAPDQRLREIALRAQQGQQLSSNDISRLAQRQGIELETARVARDVTGYGGAGVPVSTVDYLAGTRLDPRVQQATAAEATLSTNPIMQQARLQQALDTIDPVGAQARRLSDPRAKVLDDYAIATKTAQELGVDVDTARALRQPMAMRPVLPESEFSVGAAKAKTLGEGPSSASSRVEQKVGQVFSVNRDVSQIGEEASNEAMKWASEYASQTGVRPSLLQFQDRVSKIRTELEPREAKFSERDDLTGDEYEVSLLTDASGKRVYGTRGTTLKKRSPASEQLDNEFVKDYNDWTSGGASRSANDISRLDAAVNRLKTENVSGPITGRAASYPVTKIFTEAFMPGIAATETDVLSVGQNKIREIFGSNPAQAEAQRLLDRIYDKQMPESENIRRVELFRDMLIDGAKAKAQKAAYYEKYNTLSGYKGPSELDIARKANDTLDNKASNSNIPPAASEKLNSYLSKRAAKPKTP